MIKRINVTAKDIAQGERKNCGKCPVARAIARRMDGWGLVRVGGFMASFYPAGTIVDSDGDVIGAHLADTADRDLPDIAREFIGSYDNGHEVKPFRFRLDIPEPAQG